MRARNRTVAAIAFAILSIPVVAGSAQAMPLAASDPALENDGGTIVPAAEVRTYQRNNRYRYKRYWLDFGGYFEKFPAYEYSTERPAVVMNPDSAHVQWCFAAYQSYDLATDTYLAGNGSRKPCISPE